MLTITHFAGVSGEFRNSAGLIRISDCAEIYVDSFFDLSMASQFPPQTLSDSNLQDGKIGRKQDGLVKNM